MTKIQDLEPKSVFRFFEEISKIPRGSGNTKGISDYCVEFAEQRGLKVYQDEANNVVIWKPGAEGYEKSEPVILQGHLDMVCEKTAESTHDFERDPLELYTKDGFVRAKNTTLGADDGIAVAFALAVLDGTEFAHPPLEVVFTTDEETGMYGAHALDMSKLRGKTLLNLDSEDEGILTAGCAGGFSYELIQPIRREEQEGEVLEIEISGLRGGHSGVDIHKQSGNANKMAGRLLNKIRLNSKCNLIYIEGGKKDNVIPSYCKLGLLGTAEDIRAAETCAKQLEEQWKQEYGTDEPKLQVTLQNAGIKKKSVICSADAKALIFYLNTCQNGVYEYSRSLEGMVETSSNLGVLTTYEDRIVSRILVRSSSSSKLEEMKERLQQWPEMLQAAAAGKGGSSPAEKKRITGNISSEYPAWTYRRSSRIREIAVRCYRELYGKEPEVITIHAGLECGILTNKKADLDCISIGPQMYDIHSVKERLSIASTQRTWEYLLSILKACKQ